MTVLPLGVSAGHTYREYLYKIAPLRTHCWAHVAVLYAPNPLSIPLVQLSGFQSHEVSFVRDYSLLLGS